MPEHFLHCPEVCPALQKVRGEGMAESVGMHFFSDFCLLGCGDDNLPHAHPRKCAAPCVHEQRLLGHAQSHQVRPRVSQVLIDPSESRPANRHDTFLGAFPDDSDDFRFGNNVGSRHAEQFGNAQAAGVHCLEHRAVPNAGYCFDIGSRKDSFHFLDCESVWQRAPQAWQINNFCWIRFRNSLLAEVPIERAKRGQIPRAGRGLESEIGKDCQEFANIIGQRSISARNIFASEELCPPRQIACVGHFCIPRQPTFERKKMQKCLNILFYTSSYFSILQINNIHMHRRAVN